MEMVRGNKAILNNMKDGLAVHFLSMYTKHKDPAKYF